MECQFFKYHGLGNDYIVIDPRKCIVQMSKENIIRICDRNFGIGSDGILFGPFFESGKPELKIYNPDGSEAEKSGNGIRIFSRYLKEKGYIEEQSFVLRTLGGDVIVKYLDSFGNRIKVDMGIPSFKCSDIPAIWNKKEIFDEEISFMDKKYNISCVSIGNPHCVVHVSKAEKKLAMLMGPFIENNEIFPNKINMQLLQIIDRNNIQIEIWERGAQYTLASGSSSCAAAVVAYKLGLVDSKVYVHMPGGMLEINMENDHVFMTGTVSSVMSGIFTKEFLEMLL